jgi:hypothetical protein
MGFGASIIMFLLAYMLTQGPRVPKISLDGMGLLHIMWLFCRHPELGAQLDQVDQPTDHNLRAAGMVRVRLLCQQELNID